MGRGEQSSISFWAYSFCFFNLPYKGKSFSFSHPPTKSNLLPLVVVGWFCLQLNPLSAPSLLPRHMEHHPFYHSHVKLFAFDLLSLTQSPLSDAVFFSRNALPVSRAEIVGTVVSRDHKPNKFLKFALDDGTACLDCILWLNQDSSPYFSRYCPSDVRLIADMSTHFAAQLNLGVVARVRGKISSFRDLIQITVSDVVIEKDPNVQILHWLDCIRLARNCYNVLSPSA